MSKKSIQSKSGQVSVSVLSKEVGSKFTSKKTELLSKKIMLTLVAGACFFAVQNPVMAAEPIVITGGTTELPTEVGVDKDGLTLSKYEVRSELSAYYYHATVAGTPIVIYAPSSSYNHSLFVSSYSSVADATGADVTGGDATLKEGAIGGMYGGFSVNGKVSDCKATIEKGNVLNLSDGLNQFFTGYVCGGRAKADAENNQVIIDGKTLGDREYITVQGNVIGGESTTGDAIQNKVTISNVTVDNCYVSSVTGGKVYGGTVNAGTVDERKVVAKKNEVSISNGKVVNVIGGAAYGGNAEENRVTISGGKVGFRDSYASGYIQGAVVSAGGSAIKNVVTINGGEIGDENGIAVEGGFAYADSLSENPGVAEKNEVNITAGHIKATVSGGHALNASAIGNIVSIDNSDVSDVASNTVIIGKVYGGYVSNGIAKNNVVTINAAKIEMCSSGCSVYGGYTDGNSSDTVRFDATGNTVTIGNKDVDAGTVTVTDDNFEKVIPMLGGSVYGGYVTGNGSNADSNVVTVTNGNFNMDVIGGKANGEAGDAKNNVVTIGQLVADDANAYLNIEHMVCGGCVSGVEGNAEYNSLTINSGTIKGEVYGGFASGDEGNANNNSVTINGGAVTRDYGGDVYGGSSYKGSANENEVTISGGTFEGEVNGGSSYKGSANENEVTISGGTFEGGVYGGWSGEGSANENEVTISGGTFEGNVDGGRSGEGSANENEVTISGGKVALDVYGGNSGEGSANKNKVTISDGKFGYEDDYGNVSGGNVYGGSSYKGSANENEVTISGGTFEGEVNGGCSEYGEASDNKVTISGGTFKGGVYGGWSGEGSANENEVTISGGTFEGNVDGGRSGKGSANENKVTISGGDIKGVIGGVSEFGDVTGNIVEISDGTIGEGVIGGLSYVGNVMNNTVNLSGGTIKGFVLGGYVYYPDGVNVPGGLQMPGGPEIPAATISGNTLNVKGLDIKVGNIFNFDNINFFIPSSATDGSKMLTLTGVTAPETDEDIRDPFAAYYTSVTDISKANVKAGVVAIEGDSKLKVGDTVILIENEAGELITADANGKEMEYGKLTAQEGVSVKYELDIEKKGENALIATIKAGPEEGLEPQTKSLVETQAAGMAMLNGGMDMLAGEGIANAIAAAADASAAAGAGSDGVSGKGAVGAGEGRELAMFGMLGASNMKYKTGSHVDLDGWNIGLGFAKTVENNSGKLTFGPVISYGKGSYDSYLDDGIHGEGDSDYLGISLFAHQANKDGLYYEGSIGAGRVSNDYSSNDLVGADGAKVHEKYDTDSTFVAAHLGLGKKIEVSDKAKLDVYGKYFYAHQGGDDAKLATGETYHFDAVDSNRIRLGARYEIENGKAADSGKALNTLYVGTAYEYEFSGDAKATYKGMETASPSLKGSSGMLELGWKVKPSAASPLTIDLSANGWCGQKEGYGVKANFLWNF